MLVFTSGSMLAVIDVFIVPMLMGGLFYIIALINQNNSSEANIKNFITINENLKKTNSNLENKLEENKKATEYYGKETQQTIASLANELALLRKELQEEKQSKETSEVEKMHIEKTDNVIKSIIKETEKIHTQIGIGTDTSETKQLCPQCRVEMTDYGWKQTQWGLVWHYKCPNGHGIFPSTKLNDTWDE